MLLPLLYSLPVGTIAGISKSIAPHAVSEPGLAAWGPTLTDLPDLRHAARRPPRRAVVSIPEVLPPTWTVALAFLRRSGTTLVLHATRLGSLLIFAERILVDTPTGPIWRPATELVASRRLRLHFAPGPNGVSEVWEIRLGDSSPERVLAACLARRRTLLRSEIVYCDSRR